MELVPPCTSLCIFLLRGRSHARRGLQPLAGDAGRGSVALTGGPQRDNASPRRLPPAQFIHGLLQENGLAASDEQPSSE